MRSRDRECAHHHNGEDLALKGKMSIFALFFLQKKFAKKQTKLITEASTLWSPQFWSEYFKLYQDRLGKLNLSRSNL